MSASVTDGVTDTRHLTESRALPAHLVPIRVQPKRPPRLLTREQVAATLGLHPRTIDRWARRGRLRLIDLGGTVRIPAEEGSRLRGARPWTRFE